MASGNISRTWTLPIGLAEKVSAVAASLRCWDSDLVCVLLEHALDDLDAGRLKIGRRPAWYTVKAEKAQE